MMRTLLTTSELHPRDRFRFWQSAIFDRFGSIITVDLSKPGAGPFEGKLEALDLGSLLITRINLSAVRIKKTVNTIRRQDGHETLSVMILLSGSSTCLQGGQESVQHAGELVVLDRRPTVIETRANSRSLVLEIPRDRLERMLGPVALYAGLTIGSAQSSTSLVTGFFNELVRALDRLSADTAERMSAIGVDLLIASIAERLAKETPKPLAGTILVQRVKAYVESNLGDPALDVSELAIAMGVSLRRLQQLFQERGLNISDWIWQRRLDMAVVKLVDPAYMHQTVGVLAYSCGFISQSHFSRRFKSRYGMTASEYREGASRAALMRD